MIFKKNKQTKTKQSKTKPSTVFGKVLQVIFHNRLPMYLSIVFIKLWIRTLKNVFKPKRLSKMNFSFEHMV